VVSLCIDVQVVSPFSADTALVDALGSDMQWEAAIALASRRRGGHRHQANGLPLPKASSAFNLVFIVLTILLVVVHRPPSSSCSSSASSASALSYVS
jgi:hypothetical protein